MQKLMEDQIQAKTAQTQDQQEDELPSFEQLVKKLSQKNPRALTKYKLGAQLGRGAFGNVFRAQNIQTGMQVAIKIVHTATNPHSSEVKILQELQHEHIVQLLEFFDEQQEEGQIENWLIFELLYGGELQDLVREKGPLPLPQVAQIFAQVLSAVRYYQSFGLVHRDLKPQNILICQYPNEANSQDTVQINSDTTKEKPQVVAEQPVYKVKIIDWGQAKYHNNDTNVRMTERCGTTPYAAPEVLRKSYDARCDIWSLGMILYFMLTGEHPLQQHVKDEQSLENLLRNGSIPYSKRLWKALPESAKLLTQRMLTADLKKRATLDQIAEMLDQGCLNTSH